jgi:choice-of-anchor A domain-containing protein
MNFRSLWIAAGITVMGFISATGVWAGTPLGPDALLFGLLADGSVSLPNASTVSYSQQSPAPPEVGASSAFIGGPGIAAGFLTGDVIASAAQGPAIMIFPHAHAQNCISGGGTITLGVEATCGVPDSTGTNPLLTTLANAQSEVASYASYLAGLAPTTTLGDITLKKYQHLTIKLSAGVNVVSIGNITTAGVNTITFSAPKGAVVVVNISGALDLGTATQVFANTGSVNPHNLIWNIEGPDPTFGTDVVFSGTVINVAESTTVTFGARSVIAGALLTNGSVVANAALHLNFWPFTAAP